MSPTRVDSGCLFLYRVRANVEIHYIHLGSTGTTHFNISVWNSSYGSFCSLSQPTHWTLAEEDKFSYVKVQDGKICFDCAVETSPGTSEVCACFSKTSRFTGESWPNSSNSICFFGGTPSLSSLIHGISLVEKSIAFWFWPRI